jgi:hypothetical protein
MLRNANRTIAKGFFTAETPTSQRQRREEKNSAYCGALCASAVSGSPSVEPYFFITTGFFSWPGLTFYRTAKEDL